MLSQKEMDKALLEAKKARYGEQMKDILKKCSCSGSPVTMEMKGGEKIGKTD